MEVNNIKISVRNLIEFVLRSGDLDNRRVGNAEKDAMQAGSRIHRKIQRSMGSTYQAEVSLKHTVSEDEFQITIEGRADGIITETSGVTIDEIKGIYRDLVHVTEPFEIHMSQAMCYGYIYCYHHQLLAISLQVTYCNIETEEIKRFRIEKTFDQLELWFQGLIHEYIKWARYLYQHGLRRDEALRELLFPYPYRAGQKDLAVAVYRTIAQKKTLFIQAPTGIGKTLSTIYPALKAIEQGHGEKLFYLTAKTITRAVAEETFAILRDTGLYFRTVTLTAKDKLCFLDKPECNPDACEYAKGHFDRINDAVFDVIHQEFSITKEVVIKYARMHCVCPFEFCLDISDWVDGIICDYNYVFHPNIRLKRYFSDGIAGEYLFLIDEAHNLVSRAREMYSAELVKEDVLEIKRLIKDYSPKMTKQLNRCNQFLLELKRECSDFRLISDIHHIVLCLMTLLGEMEEFLQEQTVFPDRDRILDFYFTIRNFLTIFESIDEFYLIYTQLHADQTFTLKLFCINPSRQLKTCLDKGNSTIFFSATMLPINYYKELLSGNKDDYAIYAESPFPKDQRLLMVASDVSSKYTRRNETEYKKVVNYIRETAHRKVGNYIVFLPSYHFLEQIRQLLVKDDLITVLAQENQMDEWHREQFLAQFNQLRSQSMVALCVIGGVFSEGIDLTADRLIGVIIVGTGLPMVCTEQELLRDYFDAQGFAGYQFAYQFPGMNKVMQAAGRVIRTMKDKGIILLLDERFLTGQYQGLFPREWDDYVIVRRETVAQTIEQFWSKMDLLSSTTNP